MSRPRFSSLLMTIGVLLLLVAIPPYVAQSATERAMEDGMEFRLPLPRIGDRIDLEMLVTVPGNGTQSSGVLASVEFRAPRADEGPQDARLVCERRNEAANVSFGDARLSANRDVRQVFFDENGTSVSWVEERSLWYPDTTFGNRSIAAPGGRYVTSGAAVGLRSVPCSLANPESDPYRYRGHTLLETLPPLVKSIVKEGRPADEATGRPAEPSSVSISAPSAEQRALLPLAAHHRGMVLFANEVRPSNHNREFYVTGHGSPTSGLLRFDHSRWDMAVTWRGITDNDTLRQWTWISPDFPAPVGAHVEVLGPDGAPKLLVDWVPARMLRGEEDSPIHRSVADYSDGDENRTADVVSFGRWRTGHVPLVGQVTAAQIYRDLAADTAADEARAAMQAGGVIVGIAGWAAQDGMSQWYVEILVPSVSTTALALSYRDGAVLTMDLACTGSPFHWVRWQIEFECGPLGRRHLDRYLSAPDLGMLWLDSGTSYAAAGFGTPRETLLMLLPEWMTRDEDGSGSSGGQRIRFDLPGDHRGPGPWEVSVMSRVGENGASWSTLPWSRSDPPLHTQTSSTDEALFAAGKSLTLSAESDGLRRVDPVGPAAGAGGLVLLALGAMIRALVWVKGGGFLPFASAFYARVLRDKALDHRRREEIAALVGVDPGLDLSGLARRTGLHRTVAFYHARMLVRNGLLVESRLGRARHYHPAGRSEANALIEAVAHHEELARLVAVIAARPGVSLPDLAAQLGKSKSTVLRQARKLSALGIVQRERAGRRATYRAMVPWTRVVAGDVRRPAVN